MNNNKTAIYAIVMAFILILVLQFSSTETSEQKNELKAEAPNASETVSSLTQTDPFMLSANVQAVLPAEQEEEEEEEEIETIEEIVEEIVEEGTENENESSETGSFFERLINVLDPRIEAKSVLIHLLDDDVPLFYHNTLERHQLASITKLLTAVVAIENFSLEEKIVISETAFNTEGTAGNLRVGEKYQPEDLIKIMLMSSSNVASVAIEEHLGQQGEFLKAMNEKAKEIGMKNAVFEDSSGLSDFNTGTARDILALVAYIKDRHPDILEWTAKDYAVFQTADGRENTVKNVIPLTWHDGYAGGKTGTTELAGQNLVVIFKAGVTSNKKDVVFIIFRSPDRYEEFFKLLDWVERAYRF